MRKRDVEKILEELDRRAERAAKTADELWTRGESGTHYEGMAVAFDEAIALIEAVRKGRWEWVRN